MYIASSFKITIYPPVQSIIPTSSTILPGLWPPKSMFVYSVKKPCNTSLYYQKVKVLSRIRVDRKKETWIKNSENNVTLLLFLQSYCLPKQTCSWQLWHLKLIFQYGLFTINMFPQLWWNLNAELSVSSIWVHSTDSSSIGIGEIVEIPPVRNSQLILLKYSCAEPQKTTLEVKTISILNFKVHRQPSVLFCF